MHTKYKEIKREESSNVQDEESAFLVETTDSNSLDNSVLHAWMINLVVKQFVTENKMISCSNILRVFVIFIGFLGPAAYVNSAVKFANGNKTLEGIYAISEIIGGGMLTAYIFLEVIRYIGVIRADNRRTNKYTNYILLVMPILIGLFTSIPATIVGLIYNTNAKYLAFSAFTGDFVANTYTIQRLLRSQYYRKKLSKSDRVFIDRLTDNLKQLVYRITWWPSSRANSFIERYRLSSSDEFSLEQFEALIKNAVDIRQIEVDGEGRSLSYVLTGSKWILSLLLPVPWFFTNFYLTFTHLSEYLGSVFSAALLTILSTTFVFMLDVIFLKDISEFLILCIRNKRLSNYFLKKYSFKFIAIQILFLVAASCSFASRAQVIKDEIGETYGKFIMIVSSAVTLLMRFFSISNIVNDLFYVATEKLSKDSHINHIKLIHFINAFIERINVCSSNEVKQLSSIINTQEETFSITDGSSLFSTNHIDGRDESSVVINNYGL